METPEKIVDEIVQLKQAVESMVKYINSVVDRVEKLEAKIVSLQKRTHAIYDLD